MKAVKDLDKQEWLELYDSLSSDEVRLYKKLIRMKRVLPLARKLDKRRTGKMGMKEIVQVVKEIRNTKGK
jgi:hypothetical protein